VPISWVRRCAIGVKALIVNEQVAPSANSMVTTWWSTTSLSAA
jgi:hypothetical protein